MSALSLPVEKAINKFMNQWSNSAGLSWAQESDSWNEIVEKARSTFAVLINAKPENIAYSFGNSVALSSVTSCYNFEHRNEVVFNELDFPATASHVMAKNKVKFNIIRSFDGKTIPIDAYKNGISKKKTALITACHVVSNSGFRINATELIEFAHKHDIPVFLDAYQSIGSLEFDVKKFDVDYVASGCLKWLLGGFGMSFLYIRDDLIKKMNPGSIGWMGVDQPFENLFDKLRSTLRRPNDAKKFQYGTPYPIGAASALAGMEIVKNISLKKIEQHNNYLTQLIIDGIFEIGLETLTPIEPELRGSIVNVQVPNAKKIVSNLQKKLFYLDYRVQGIRISPHFYNSEEEIYQFLQQLSLEIK